MHRIAATLAFPAGSLLCSCMIMDVRKRMRLTDWGRLYGLNRISTWRMCNEGRLPSDLKVEKVGDILYVIVPEYKRLLTVGYARVSSSGRKHLLEGQPSRLWKYAGENGIAMDRVVEEVASGLNDRRKKLLSLLSDPDVGWLVVEHRDRLARFGVGMVDAMLRARDGGLVVVDESEVDDDLVRDMTEIMTSFCARLCGGRSARKRGRRVLEAGDD